MTAMGHFLYNSLSKSLKYDLWQLWAISITIPYRNHWNITYDCYGPFPLQFLIKIIEIWPMTALGNFHYNSLSQPLKYDLWQLWAISFTIPHQNHWNMTNVSYGPFPLQFLIKIMEIWPMIAMGNFLYNSLSKSLKYDLRQRWGHFHYNSSSKSVKYDLWLLWAISFTIPRQNHSNVTFESYGPFQLKVLIKTIEIWAMTPIGNFLYNSLSKSLKYDLWQLLAISITIPYQNHWNMTYDN